MIPFYNRAVHRAQTLDALVRVRIVTDQIPQTDKMCTLACVRIGQSRFERFKVRVDIAQNGETHGEIYRGGTKLGEKFTNPTKPESCPLAARLTCHANVDQPEKCDLKFRIDFGALICVHCEGREHNDDLGG